MTVFIGETDRSATAYTKLILHSDSTPRPFAAIIFKQKCSHEGGARINYIPHHGVPRAPYVDREAPLRSASVELRE